MSTEAFMDLVLPVKNRLYRFALRMLGDVSEAEDVVQEVMMRLWNGRDQMDQIQNMEAWCMQITKNLSLDKLRLQQRTGKKTVEPSAEMQHDGLTPDATTELDESMQHIHHLITALPEKQRQVMHLRDVEGYSYQEICDILELDMNQVKVNLFRARNAVREKLIKMNAYGLG